MTNAGHLGQAFADVLDQNSMAYQRVVENLSTKQINFLCALAQGISELSSKDVLAEYELGISANVVKIKRMLLKNEMIDMRDGEPGFVDPVFKRWFIREYGLKENSAI